MKACKVKGTFGEKLRRTHEYINNTSAEKTFVGGAAALEIPIPRYDLTESPSQVSYARGDYQLSLALLIEKTKFGKGKLHESQRLVRLTQKKNAGRGDSVSICVSGLFSGRMLKGLVDAIVV